MEKYRINYESIPHGVISWRHDGLDSVYCEAGEEVRITWQPSAGWGLSEAHYTDANGNEVDIDTKEMAFIMPESDITIGGTFKRFVVTDWEGYEGGGGGGGTKDYNGLDNKPSINGVTLQGNKTGKELKLDDVEYVSTFDGVTGSTEKLYYLDTAYSTYEKGFYRFIPTSGGNPEKFVLLNKELFKYVSTFTGETGDVDRLYFLDTEYDIYKVGFYRFIEAQGGEPAKFVRINPSPIKYVSTFDGVTGSTEALYYLDTAYDSYEVGFYRFVPASGGNPDKFVSIDRQRFKYVSTFTGEVGDLDRLYYLDTNYDEYTIGFYRYIEVEESGVTVGKFVQIGNPQQLQVTYAKLKEMRDNSMLVAGMQYRITDYVATTVQDDTQSANHPFDIIVTADSANKLNENAYAALHEGDTYFANSDLSAWKLKYCLDNDTSRFAWADVTNGKGVVYYMKDEFNNECPYDFKNVQFRPANKDVDANLAGLNRGYYYYTLSKVTSSSQAGISDNSINGMFYCNNNRIGVYCDRENKIVLNFIILLSSNDYQYCRLNSFDDMCRDNYCGAGFRMNSIAYNCNNNSFGSNVFYMEFGSGCYKNLVESVSSRISIGSACYNNRFAYQVTNVKFGDVCYDNIIGENSKNVSFSFGCYSNTIREYSDTVSFEANCYSNFIQRYSKFITLGHDCSNNTFGYLAGVNGNFSTITFGSSCKYNKVRNGIKKLDVGNNVNYCNITTVGDSQVTSNLVVLDNTQGKSSTSLLEIVFQRNKSYTQYAGLKSDGKLRIWNIADIGDVEKENIIDVTVLPTTDIDTDALYRLATTHYYHNNTELTDPPQGYKSLNAEALVADENGLTAIEGETSTTTPWAEVTDAMIATLVSGSLVATCEFGEAGFYKTAADEYDYARNFSTADTYTLWHNATGKPTDWIEVDSVDGLATDGVTTEDVNGELRANAIVDVTTLPTTGIKAKTLYRMRVHRYLEDGTELSDTPSGYLSIRPAIVIIDENGITDNGTHYAWADITDDQMNFWIIRRQISQVYAADLMTMSTCFKTAANHYVYKDHVTEEEVYELYHNPTETANEFIKIGGGAASVETDDVTTQEVDGKLQANAIIEVQTLPATGYKQNSLYRMLDTATQTFKRYYYNASADPLPETPTFYKGDGEHLVFGADGYTLNGNPGSYSSITQITLSVWMNNGWVSETTDFSEAGMFRVPGGLAVYDSTTKLTEEDYVVTAEMDKVFKRVQGGWECISYIQLEKEQYDILSDAQKNDGTLYIVNDKED